jgi:branched-chain amino acid transport system substrate-binding protein
MDHFIGNWWSANDSDVVPAGEGAKGYKGATAQRARHQLQVHADIVKHVYDKGKGAAKKEEMGTAFYNRGVVNAMLGRGHPVPRWPSTAPRRRPPVSRCVGASRT